MSIVTESLKAAVEGLIARNNAKVTKIVELESKIVGLEAQIATMPPDESGQIQEIIDTVNAVQ